jgi:hypothetical protein
MMSDECDGFFVGKQGGVQILFFDGTRGGVSIADCGLGIADFPEFSS